MDKDVIIRVEGLGKRYTLGAASNERYTALRDVLAQGARRLARAGRRATETDASPASTDFWALKDVSFEVGRGEVVGIIGRNGAGKSTLLKILSRITEPTTGKITLKGRVASLLEVGTGFHPELTGRENIYLNGAILGMHRAEIKAKFDEIVAFAEVEKFLDTPVKRYSSGMYVRLAFAVAAHLEPEILIVDEVLAVGDTEFQKKCLGKMQGVAKDGRTVLFVSHNMQAVSHLCSGAMLLRNGKLQSVSSDVTSIIKQYLVRAEDQQPAIWENLQAEWHHKQFTPTRFFVGDALGNPQPMPLRRDQPSWVYIEGNIVDFDPALQIGYELFADDATLLFMCFTTDQEEMAWPVKRSGRVSVRSHLPVWLLNEGSFRLEISAGLRWRQWFCIPGTHAPSIEIEVVPGEPISPYWVEKRPGLLAPLVRWEKTAS